MRGAKCSAVLLLPIVPVSASTPRRHAAVANEHREHASRAACRKNGQKVPCTLADSWRNRGNFMPAVCLARSAPPRLHHCACFDCAPRLGTSQHHDPSHAYKQAKEQSGVVQQRGGRPGELWH